MGRGRGQRAALNRGAIHDVDLPTGRHPAVVITREVAIPLLANVTVAAITSRVRGLPTEVRVGREHGLTRDSVINCDNVFTVPKTLVGRRRGMLDDAALIELRAALALAFELD